MKLKYLKIQDFTSVKGIEGTYGGSIRPKCRWENYRNVARISYRLPNNLKKWYYPSKDIISNLKSKEAYIKEFDSALLNGYFPNKVLESMESPQLDVRDGEISIKNAIDAYYNEYNSGKRQKSKKTIDSERKTLSYILTTYFIEKMGIKTLSGINTDVLVKFNKEIEVYKVSGTDKPLSVASVATYKKLVKAFLNCLIEYEKIDRNCCDTTKIITTVYNKGRADYQALSRLVKIPMEIVDAIKNCTYETNNNLPDMKELFLLASETGLRKSELLTLGTSNLYPNVDSFNSLSIYDKKNCPTKYEVGFYVKSANSIRIVPLSTRSISFIKKQLEKHKFDERYGIVGSRRGKHNLIKYPFLFPRYDFQMKRWIRMDDFDKSFKSLINKALEEAKLNDSTRYTFHDLRRTVNLWLRGSNFSAEQASMWLGHSERTNNISYLALSDKQELIYKKNLISAQRLFSGDSEN